MKKIFKILGLVVIVLIIVVILVGIGIHMYKNMKNTKKTSLIKEFIVSLNIKVGKKKLKRRKHSYI